MFLLDTNVISEMAKKQPNPGVIEKIKKHQHEISTAAPVWHELQFGCFRLPFSKQRNYLESFLENVIRQNIDILPYEEKAAQWHALNRARLSAEGKTPSFVDGQIAGIAYTNGLILVTRNMSDFRAFPDLQIRNWHRSV